MITVRLPTVDSVSAYLESVQDEVAAVLIAKRTLLRAKSSNDVLDMRITIDERVQDIAIAMLFGSQIKSFIGSRKNSLYCQNSSSISEGSRFWEAFLVMKMKGLCFGICF